MFVFFNSLPAQAFEILNGRMEGHGAFDVFRAGFKFKRQYVEGRRLFLYIFDHVPAQQEGFHVIKKFFFAVDDARTGRAEHLVSGKNHEITVQRLYVDFHMRHRLRAVIHDDGSNSVGSFNDFFSRHLHAQHIADAGEGYDFSRCINLSQIVFRKMTCFVEIHIYQLRAGRTADPLPCHEVGMVL